MPVASSNLDYLIEDLRLHLGDTDSTAYRYTDAWLLTSLVAAVKGLRRWWNSKYLIDTDNDVYRNTIANFIDDSPPIVQTMDERPIILMASIIIKGGSLESSSWNLGHWRDNEISYSNIQGGKSREYSLDKDVKELETILVPPNKKLRASQKRSLPGYQNSLFEAERK